jgi:hypothetical protein
MAEQTSGTPPSVEALAPRARSDDPVTVIAAGALAATLAAICHETLGHGLGCIGVGGRIILLTSIWFQCDGATSLTDAGGPLASLIAGLAAFGLLSLQIPSRAARFILVLFGALSLFWFAAQLIDHAIIDRDDWGFIARRMGWSWVWRPVAATIGVAAYAAAIRLTTTVLRRHGAPGRHAIRLAYVAAVASAVIAGLMWSPAPIKSAIEGFLTLGIAPLGLLVAAARAGREADRVMPTALILRSWSWIAVSVAVFGSFLIVQGRGLGSLARIGLPH